MGKRLMGNGETRDKMLLMLDDDVLKYFSRIEQLEYNITRKLNF